jgi:hypothetical protein
MADQVMLIGNPTGTTYTDVNAAGDDILAYAVGSTQTNANGLVTLSDAEQATFAAAHTSALIVLFDSTTQTAAHLSKMRRTMARMLKYRSALKGPS